MCSVTCFVFFKWDKVKSRAFLGICAVVSVMLSIASGYGIMFIVGVPLSSITNMLPFIVFGIGLDDAFIIMGSYARSDPKMSAEERMRETIDDVGVSITLTTTTSVLAFAIGSLSSVPAIIWVCLYAFPCVIMVYMYQITFFVACIMLDQKRIDENRRDCCTWITVSKDEDENEDEEEQQQHATDPTEDAFFSDRFMIMYAEFLLHPWVKVGVVAFFVGLAVSCALSATKLHQEFKVEDVLPSDSYITTFLQARTAYSSRTHFLNSIIFRDVDQSDPEVQAAMYNFVQDVSELEVVTTYPDFFWLRDMQRFAANQTIDGYSFRFQLKVFLGHKVINEVYGNDVVFDNERGSVFESRCFIDMGHIDVDNINQQMEILREVRRIANEQPINQGRERKAFFTYSIAYNIWEFYVRAVGEIASSAVSSIIAVSIVALFLIPHWSAAFIILPLMVILYIDILGFMQFCGVTINPVTYVVLAMSIGLLVDFMMHVLLKYYELPGTRREKTIEMLRTMGSSIFLGGFTTFLGTVPLIFSSSTVFFIVFIGFMGLVLIGVGHGLVLLPVILSTIGTESQVTTSLLQKAHHNRAKPSTPKAEKPALKSPQH